MAWQNTQLLVKLALDLSKYVSGMRTAGTEGEKAMGGVAAAGAKAASTQKDLGQQTEQAAKKIEAFKARTNESSEAQKDWTKWVEKTRTEQEKLATSLRKVEEAGRAAGVSQKEIADVQDRLRTKVDDSSTSLMNLATRAGVAFGAIATGVAAMVMSTANAAKEVERLSTLTGIGTTQFQQWAYGARTVGIQQDKLADILKDVNDKVGEFLQTGGGPMKDFFDNVAPRVGVTAEQFSRLGGADALQLYVKSLQAANLSQSEMTFYLEALASDSTLLLPLLADNGAALRTLADEGERLGVVMDTQTIEANKRFADSVDTLIQGLNGAKLTIGSELIPVLQELVTGFTSAETGSRSMAEFVGGTLRTTLEASIVLGRNVAYVFATVGDHIGASAAAMSRLLRGDLAGVKAISEEYRRISQERRAALDEADRRTLTRPATVQYSKDDQSAAESARLGITAAQEAGRAATVAAQQAEKARQVWERMSKSSAGALQKREADMKAVAEAGKTLGKSDEEIKALQDQIAAKYEKSTKARQGLTAAEREAKREQEAQAALLARLSGVNTDYVQQLGRLQAIREDGKVSEERYLELMEELISIQPLASQQIKEHQKALEDQAKAITTWAGERAKSTAEQEKELQRAREEVAAMGLTKTALSEVAAARLEVAAAAQEEYAANLRAASAYAEEYRHAYLQAAEDAERQAKLMRQRAATERERATKQEALDTQKTWDKTWDQVAQSMTDALINGGRSASDVIEDMFKTLVLRPIVEPVMKAAGNWLNNLLGGSGGGFDFSKITSLFGGDGFSWGKLSSVFSGGGASAASTYGTAAVYDAAAIEAANTAAMNAAMASEGAAASSAAAGASVASIAGWVAVGIATSANMYKAGWDRNAMKKGGIPQHDFGQHSSTTGQSQYTGNVHASVLKSANKLDYSIWKWLGASEKWATILSGAPLTAGVWGRKLKGYGFDVGIAGQDVSVQGYEYHKGGLLRSNKTVNFDVDARDAESLRRQVEDVRDASAAMARALGYSDEAIDSFTGSLRINFKGSETAEEQAERYNEALTDLNRQMVNAATGADYTSEQFKSMMDGIGQAMADAGISAEGIADILVDGIMGRMSEAEVGAALSDMIVGGIYESIASSYAGQIASVFTGQILTPMFAAMAAGVPVSQAISQQAIQNVVATAQSAAAALNAIFNDAGFRSAIAGIETAIRGVAGAVSKVKVPSFGSARLAATNTAAQKRNEIERERYQLETQLAQALGLTALLRQRELASLDASNRHLQVHIWALEDAKSAIGTAMEALERAIEAQREAVQTQLDGARALESHLNDVFQVLKDGIRDLRGEVVSTSRMSADAGRALIQRALGGEKMDSDELADAIDAVRSYIEQTNYASRFERDKAALSFAADLDRLGSITERELSEAERQVLLLEEQLTSLDAQLEAQQQAVDALYGIDTSVKSVSQAVAALSGAMATYTAAVQAASAVNISAGAAPSSSTSSSAGSVSVSGGGGGSSSKQWTAAGYMSKNPDLQAYWAANGAELARDRGWTVEDYAQWHWQNYGQKENRKFAKGGAFTNGIVTRPTLFDIGQMGEAGKEAIMPLSNVGGSLGVRAIIGGDDETKALLRKVLASLGDLNRTQEAGVVYASRTTAILRKAQRPGGALAVQAPDDQPVAVEVVSP